MKLQTKLLLIFAVVFVTSFAVMEYIHYHNVKREVIIELRREARNIRGVLMATRRTYLKQFLKSEIELTDKTLGFLPAYAMSRISEDFKNWTNEGLTFNNVSDRPRNPKNLADALEKEAMSYFRNNPKEKERLVPYESEEEGLYYHYSAPIWIEKYCLKCHGKREAVPITIRTNYDTAFDYKLGELRGIMSIKLPATKLQLRIWEDFQHDFWAHLAGLSTVFILVFFLLRRYVTTPVKKLARGIKSVSEGVYTEPIEDLSGEMADLGNSFNQMSKNLYNREERLKRFKILFDNVSDLAYICDAKGNILFVNKVFKNLTGHSPEEFIDKPFGLLFDEVNLKKALDVYNRTLKGESLEYELCFKDTGIICEYKNLPLLDEKENIIGVIGIARNVTERKRMEKKLLKSEKLNALGVVTAGVAHEFNNILSIISGNVQMLEIGYVDKVVLKDKVRIIRKVISDGIEIVRRMNVFTGVVKDFSKYLTFDIRDIIRQTIDFTMPMVKNREHAINATFNINLDGLKDTSTTLMCNPTEMREVFVNLINNALDAMPDGGTISFETWTKNDIIFVKVSDTGKGMSKDVQGRVFDPFFTTRRPEGSGLGLSVVFGIMEKHGGKINVESEEGKGSTFILQFPTVVKSKSNLK